MHGHVQDYYFVVFCVLFPYIDVLFCSVVCTSVPAGVPVVQYLLYYLIFIC